jgi:hypothetical protein
VQNPAIFVSILVAGLLASCSERREKVQGIVYSSSWEYAGVALCGGTRGSDDVPWTEPPQNFHLIEEALDPRPYCITNLDHTCTVEKHAYAEVTMENRPGSKASVRKVLRAQREPPPSCVLAYGIGVPTPVVDKVLSSSEEDRP